MDDPTLGLDVPRLKAVEHAAIESQLIVTGLPHGTLLISVDYEDWHQLIRRRAGARDWERPGPALARQTEALLELLAVLRLRATFFILGMAARAHPELVATIARAGHEIACHGDAHRPVHAQTPDAFAADVRAACATIEELTGQRPRGYRAPAFSITDGSRWAYPVLAAEGFEYDASQHDSLLLPDRVVPAAPEPHVIEEGRLWEFPVAVWAATARVRVPVGGASYWSVVPPALVRAGMRRVPAGAGLYLHPQEFDSAPLRPALGPGVTPRGRVTVAARIVLREAARRRAPGTLRAIAGEHPLMSYGEAHAELRARSAARP